jgi:hypothetical protein
MIDQRSTEGRRASASWRAWTRDYWSSREVKWNTEATMWGRVATAAMRTTRILSLVCDLSLTPHAMEECSTPLQSISPQRTAGARAILEKIEEIRRGLCKYLDHDYWSRSIFFLWGWGYANASCNCGTIRICMEKPHRIWILGKIALNKRRFDQPGHRRWRGWCSTTLLKLSHVTKDQNPKNFQEFLCDN